MADGTKINVDFSEAIKGLQRLVGQPFRESLCRRMLVEGGVLLRDAAKANALVADNAEGVERRGLLASAVYLAYDSDESTNTLFQYKISWNHKVAPHGHLVEFGHIRKFKVYKGKNGEWYTRTDLPLEGGPRREPARPFIRPAWDNNLTMAINAMMERGKREFPILLQEQGNGSGS